ncbi:glycosyltransferase family 2 protein [Spirosoma pollinicola]|uniref:Glycosyltransferase family 2 protein n=1 Tax=Spirosoma pollinicola TaxID=2057025 RepID=A0A2K8Z5B4_9BACT|nr:glycosyltransferase [Spirosoma pollinicola]AUD05065.1 glycosyltransferase family 2 protein [Spirosoma pollinicola]
MISVVIPTYNAISYLPKLLQKLGQQTLAHELIIIDSGSTDGTKELLNGTKATLVNIDQASFNHGSTRNLGLNIAQRDIVLFMTQDALPVTSNTFELLVNMLCSSDNIAMAYGRQLPYAETKIFGRFARMTNYPGTSLIKDKSLISKLGIKTCSCSNSFAAYKKDALKSVGEFPDDTILGEDVSVAARMILRGLSIAYCAEAEVFHSHDYSITEEFKRYFDIGVFHNEQKEVLKEFSQAESEGIKYVRQEIQFLRENGHSTLIMEQVIRTLAKYIGYRLGRLEAYIPVNLKSRISMHKSFWLR